MIYTAIDTFYLTDQQLEDSPSRKDDIDAATETTLRIYGCDLIQESGILLKLPQAVMATGQVLFHRFYCKKSFKKFNVKMVAASCVWLASKLEECPRKARQVLIVFHRMECRRENLLLEHLDTSSKKYGDLKANLIRTERHLLKEMGFICHVEHPHKFISNYLATLETPPELSQEAWNLANDSLRTTLCVRFKSEVVACGVVYAAARRFQVPLPENPPWWKAFDADKSGIDEVCRVLAHLYSLPKAEFIPVCKEDSSFAISARSSDLPHASISKDNLLIGNGANDKGASDTGNQDAGKEEVVENDPGNLKASDKNHEDSRITIIAGGSVPEPEPKLTSEKKSESVERVKDKENDKERDRERERGRYRKRGREDSERDRDKAKERDHRSKDREKDYGRMEKSKHHHHSRERDYSSSYSSRDKDRRRHHSYA